VTGLVATYPSSHFRQALLVLFCSQSRRGAPPASNFTLNSGDQRLRTTFSGDDVLTSFGEEVRIHTPTGRPTATRPATSRRFTENAISNPGLQSLSNSPQERLQIAENAAPACTL